MKLLAGCSTLMMAIAIAFSQGCGAGESKDEPPGPSLSDVPGHEGVGVDTRRLQGPRAMPAEVYLRSFMQLFGTSTPAETLALAKGTDGAEVFDTWSAHVAALGLPTYGADVARAGETNTLMMAAFERLGMALCERSAERDFRAGGGKVVFDFALAEDPLDRNAFDAGFDSLHRTILGYPSLLAPARGGAFFDLYRDVVARHGVSGTTSRLSPAEAGWAVVCEALVRHPEFHLY